LRVPEALDPDRLVYGEAIVGAREGLGSAAVGKREKWMARGSDGVVSYRRRYDLVSDLGEERPLAWSDDERGAGLLVKFQARDPNPERGRRLKGPKVGPREDEEAPLFLEALGYVER